MFIFPKNVLGDGLTPQNAFAMRFFDATFNPTSGAQTAGSSYYPGPLFATTASIEQF